MKGLSKARGAASVSNEQRYEDQDFSLADAVSFEVMTAREIREVLTLDPHFAAAGFVIVPAS